MALEHLPFPPIVEVVCGVAFAPLSELDPLLFGVYWKTRKDDYPNRRLMPALTEEASPDFLPIRAWLLSEDEAWIVQLQSDRFYLNWRKRQQTYPRFSTHDGQPGMLERVINEYGAFASFCQQAAQKVPVIQRIELAKIDHLRQGKAWNDSQELIRLLPVLASIMPMRQAQEQPLVVRFSDVQEGAAITVTVSLGTEPEKGGLVNLETRVVMQFSAPPASLRDEFSKANGLANQVFEKLIPQPERQRFAGGPV